MVICFAYRVYLCSAVHTRWRSAQLSVLAVCISPSVNRPSGLAPPFSWAEMLRDKDEHVTLWHQDSTFHWTTAEDSLWTLTRLQYDNVLALTIWFEYCVYSGAQSSLPGSLLPHGHEDEDESFPAPLAGSNNGRQRGELQSPEALFLTDWHHTRLMLPLFKRLPLSPLAHALLLAPSISQDGFGHQIPTGLSIKAQSSCSEAKLNWKPRGHINTSQAL